MNLKVEYEKTLYALGQIYDGIIDLLAPMLVTGCHKGPLSAYITPDLIVMINWETFKVSVWDSCDKILYGVFDFSLSNYVECLEEFGEDHSDELREDVLMSIAENLGMFLHELQYGTTNQLPPTA